MTDKLKTTSNAALFWVIGVIVAAMVLFVYLFISDAPKTLAKINLSYFVDEEEIARSVTWDLSQEINRNKNYWIGVEPDKSEQLEVAVKLKNEIEKKKGDRQRKIAGEEAASAKEQKDKATIIKDDCDKALAQVMPIYHSAMKAVKALSAADVTELKAVKKPSAGMLLVA